MSLSFLPVIEERDKCDLPGVPEWEKYLNSETIASFSSVFVSAFPTNNDFRKEMASEKQSSFANVNSTANIA